METKTIRLIVRGFGDKKLLFEDHIMIDEAKSWKSLQQAAETHAHRLMQYEMHMLELEFPDEPDPLQRFYRWGTDRSMMVRPAAINDPESIN